MAKTFETRIQDLVYDIEGGMGLRLLKLGLYMLFVILVLVVYTATQFTSFGDKEAMEFAQLGRNLSERGTLTTQVVRPSTIRFLIENNKTIEIEESGKHAGKVGNPPFDDHPDILHPPLYPAAIAGWFKVLGTKFEYLVAGAKHDPERQIVALCHIFTVLTGIFVWLLGRSLFDQRVGLLGMTIFFLSDSVWSTSISGLNLSMAACLVTVALYFGIMAAANREKEMAKVWRITPFVLCALCCLFAVLTSYGAWIVVPTIALYFGIRIPDRGWTISLALIAVVLIGMTPWIFRNVNVSGAPFGIAPSTALVGTGLFPKNSFDRTLALDEKAFQFEVKYKAIRAKFFTNLSRYYKYDLRSVGDGIFICLFVTTFLYKFVRKDVHQFRWCILLAFFLLFLSAGFYGDRMMVLTLLFWPVVIIYGLAFYYLLLDRLKLRMQLQRMAVTTLVVLISAGPLILTLMPPRKGHPYPPYNQSIVTHITSLLEKNESICSDMPWATAWYGGRNSLLIPQTLDEFYEINDFMKKISGLYLTTVSRDQPYARSLMTGPDRSWFPIHQGRIPRDFPLTQVVPLLNLDQLFITDRNHLEQL